MLDYKKKTLEIHDFYVRFSISIIIGELLAARIVRKIPA